MDGKIYGNEKLEIFIDKRLNSFLNFFNFDKNIIKENNPIMIDSTIIEQVAQKYGYKEKIQQKLPLSKKAYVEFYIKTLNNSEKLTYNGDLEFYIESTSFVCNHENKMDKEVANHLLELNNFNFIIQKINNWLLFGVDVASTKESTIYNILKSDLNIENYSKIGINNITKSDFEEMVVISNFMAAFLSWMDI